MGEKDIPVLDDKAEYSTWKKEVQIWMISTNLAKNKQAAKLIMNMRGKPREVAVNMGITDIQGDDCMAKLFEALDKLYSKDTTQSLFKAIDDFEGYRRPDHIGIDEYILEFQRLYRTLKQSQNNEDLYNSKILAYRLLNQASLKEEQQRLVRATCTKDLTYDMMEEQLRRTFGEGLGSKDIGSKTHKDACEIKFKEEPQVFYQNQDQHCLSSGDNEDTIYFNGYTYRRDKSSQQKTYAPSVPNSRNNSIQRERPKSPQNWGNRNQQKPYFQQRKGPNTKLCFVCDEPGHIAIDCPLKRAKSNGQSHNNRTTFFKSDFDLPDSESQMVYLIGETANKALLDTGATSTVCGKLWFKVYEDSLNNEEKGKISTENCYKAFRFGDGDKVESTMCKRIPVKICGKSTKLNVHIVDNDIPLLLSRNCMKDMGMIIDLPNDQVRIDNTSEDMITTESGHQVIAIGRCEDNLKEKIDYAHPTYLVQPTNSEECAAHLHRYFAHGSAKKIGDFVRTTNLPNTKEICGHLKDIERNCDFCLKHKSKEIPHRKVAIPLGTTFNDVVAMDLKKLSTGDWIVHYVDTVTRYSSASAIKDKSSEEILTKTFLSWISVFGRPATFISDNGGEFVNQQFNEMCQTMGIEIKTSPSESPWCNGTVERHNGILAKMIESIMEDTGCNLDIAIAWSVNAKNSLNSVFGFSSHQFVFGQNPKVPGLLNDDQKLPMLNDQTSSKVVAEHLTALNEARRKFIELENSSRLKRALQERVQESSNIRYTCGDIVYFKRNKEKVWNGPASVVGQINNQVLIKQGGLFVRIHPCKVILKSKADDQINKISRGIAVNPPKSVNTSRKWVTKDIANNSDTSSDSEQEDEPQHSTSITSHLGDQSETQSSAPNNISTLEQSSQLSDSEDNNAKWVEVSALDSREKAPIKVNDIIRFRQSAEEDWNSGLVLSRAGRASSDKTKNRFNVQKDGDDLPSYMDADIMQVEKQVDEAERVLLMQEEVGYTFFNFDGKDLASITSAKEKEIARLKEFQVYEEVKDQGQNAISTRWVMTSKGDNGKEVVKGRLVARGFEEMCLMQTDSPTVSKPAIRLMFALSASLKWPVETMDITSAFLQSNKMEREVFVKPPADIRKRGIIWKLKKPLYGLGDSARMWYLTLRGHITKMGCEMSKIDKSLFMYYENNKLQGMIVIHVDDILHSGSTRFKKTIIKSIYDKFKVSRSHSGVFTYIGWNVSQEKDCIYIDQQSYAQAIRTVKLDKSPKRDSDAVLNEEEKSNYQGLLGKLLWLSSQSRPDLSFDTLEHSTYNKNPKVKNIASLNKVVRKLDQGPAKICYRALNLEKGNLQLLCFTDASLGNLSETKHSARGYLIFLTDGKVANLIAWSSNKVKRVVHSIFGAETLSCIDGTGAAIFIRQLISEILFRDAKAQTIPITVLTDSKQLYDSTNSTSQCSDKRLVLDIAELQETIQSGEVKALQWIPTNKMLADILTKKGVCDSALADTLETGYFNLDYYLSR